MFIVPIDIESFSDSIYEPILIKILHFRFKYSLFDGFFLTRKETIFIEAEKEFTVKIKDQINFKKKNIEIYYGHCGY